METFHALKEKITQLLDKTKELTETKEKLLLEIQELNQKILSLESALMNNDQHLAALELEKDSTKTIIDDLIKNIDTLISNER